MEQSTGEVAEMLTRLRAKDARIADLLSTLEAQDVRILELLAAIELDESRIEALLARLARADERVGELLEVVDLRDSQIVQLVLEVEGLLSSREHRAVIEQAKGVIMSTMQCSPDAAFAVLVAQSSAENRKLRDIAQELAALQDRHPPSGPTA